MKAFSIALGLLLVVFSSSVLLLDRPAGPNTLATRAYESLFEGGRDGVARAVAGFREALAKDPASPYRWCDLGEALLEAGEIKKARYCFTRAFRLGPNIPPVLLRVANFHFRVNEPREALRSASRILELASEYDQIIFSTYAVFAPDVETVLRWGVPNDRRAAQAWFRHLLRGDEAAEAAKAWGWLSSRSFADDTLAGRYVDFLLARRRYDEAAEAWGGHLSTRRGDYLLANHLFNADFEFEPSGTRLDWRVSRGPGFEAVRVPDVARSGRWSLGVRFEASENLAFRHVSQTAVVRAGRWRFQGWLRAEAITTDQGVAFRLYDPEAPARLGLATEALTGTTDWKLIERTFVVPAETRLLEVQLSRRPSLKFDNKIGGTLWVDAVRLAPVR